MTRIDAARSLATWFGCGLSPWAPGTVGSLGAILPALALSAVTPLNGFEIAACGILLLAPAIWAAGLTARVMHAKDPGLIVVDEVVGQWIAFAGVTHLNWKNWLFAFLLFRAFDITKPFPIRRLEKLPGGIGIVADDALAGIYAALVLFLMGWFNFY
jgi:phosphatidylglycerophosphatase A